MRLLLAAGAAALLAAGCGGVDDPQVAVLLPDHRSAGRWQEEAELFEEAFRGAGIRGRVENARGDAATMAEQAREALDDGAEVLVLVGLDPTSATEIARTAQRRGARVVDYDRLAVRGRGADVFVGYDHRATGRLLVRAVGDCLGGAGRLLLLTGPPDDRGSRLLSQGVAAALEDETGLRLVARRAVRDWDPDIAQALFELVLAERGEVDAVVTARDALAEPVLRVAEARGLEVEVASGDGDEEGVERVRAGRQCVTVERDREREVAEAVRAARALLAGRVPGGTTLVFNGRRFVPGLLLQPVPVRRP